MKLLRYKARFHEGDWTIAKFELRLDEDNRPFHIVLDRDKNVFIFNEMVNGDWAEERLIKTEVKLSLIDGFYAEVFDASVLIYLDDELHKFGLPVCIDEVILGTQSAGIEWELSVEKLDDAKRKDEKGEWLPNFHLAGRHLRVPSEGDAKLKNKLLFYPSFEKSSSYINYLASHTFKEKKMPPVILDFSPYDITNALAASILIPNSSVFILSGDLERDDLLKQIIDINNIDNINILDSEDLLHLLSTSDGNILVQGDDVFRWIQPRLETLDNKNRSRMSIYTNSPDPIPGNIVFPCAHALITVNGRWTLNHSQREMERSRHQGLDITVAAYNARDYLIQCAESLLCKERDDISVIIVDDGSTDGCGELAARHFADDHRVRVERKPNGGCASARNYGRLVSDASHIAFVDADDFVSTNFFADLYDLALYSGNEVVQAGFDFYDESLTEPFYASYEEDSFATYPQEAFGHNNVISINSQDIIKGQPTIWRRVYRRDFLDAKNIYFPENIRAFDDYIFHILTLTAARDILMVIDHHYHYRQHPAQDIKQGDERHFYMIQMFRTLLRRSLEDGWFDFRVYAESIIDSINWSCFRLRADLVDTFLSASARLLVAIHKVYGEQVIHERLLASLKHPDFMFHFQEEMNRVGDLPGGSHWAYVSGEFEHPDIIRMGQKLSRVL